MKETQRSINTVRGVFGDRWNVKGILLLALVCFGSLQVGCARWVPSLEPDYERVSHPTRRSTVHVDFVVSPEKRRAVDSVALTGTLTGAPLIDELESTLRTTLSESGVLEGERAGTYHVSARIKRFRVRPGLRMKGKVGVHYTITHLDSGHVVMDTTLRSTGLGYSRDALAGDARLRYAARRSMQANFAVLLQELRTTPSNN